MTSRYQHFGDAPEIFYRNDTDEPLSADAQLKNNTRYIYFKKIAQGGKCNIRSCRDLHLARVVCHKTLRKEFADDAEQKRMFLREARVTAMLQHPNTAPVYEVGFDRQGRYYFTMKLVAGATLREVFDDLVTGKESTIAEWDLHRLIDVVIQVGQVLSYAHTHGVVHCDVKPENIVVGEFGEVMLLDWGMAYLRDRDETAVEDEESNSPLPLDGDMSLRSLESHPGTPLYMSPEQIVGGHIDHRTDIYSLGAVLFEALTQQPLAWGGSIEEMLRNKLSSAPPPASVVTPDRMIPTALDSLCHRCVQQQPSHRIQTMLEVIHELLYWLRMEGTHRPM